jgi:hypothetical protein
MQITRAGMWRVVLRRRFMDWQRELSRFVKNCVDEPSCCILNSWLITRACNHFWFWCAVVLWIISLQLPSSKRWVEAAWWRNGGCWYETWKRVWLQSPRKKMCLLFSFCNMWCVAIISCKWANPKKLQCRKCGLQQKYCPGLSMSH